MTKHSCFVAPRKERHTSIQPRTQSLPTQPGSLVHITLNGESYEVAEGATISDLLQQRQLDPRYLAVEVNRQVIPRAQHRQHVLQASDVVEVVTLVGGG